MRHSLNLLVLKAFIRFIMASRSTILIFAAAMLACHHAVNGDFVPFGGGIGAVKPADIDSDAKQIANSATVKEAILEELQRTNTVQNEYEVISNATQVVAGTNYFLKIKINSHPPAYIHARVLKKLDGTHEVYGVQTGHTATDPISYF